MPIARKCPESGGIVFDLTDEEKMTRDTADNVNQLALLVKSLQAEIEALKANSDS